MPTFRAVITPLPNAEPVIRLIDGKNAPQVLSFVARNSIVLNRVTAREAHELARQGIELEDATATPPGAANDEETLI